MQIIPLTTAESASSGFTHKVIMTYSDLLAETSGAATEIFPKLTATSPTLPVGTRVRACALQVVTLGVAASMTDLVVTLGDDGSANRFLTSSEVGGTTTPVTAGVWYETFAAAPYIYTTANTIDAVFTATGAALSALTAGEWHIWLAICDGQSLSNGQPSRF